MFDFSHGHLCSTISTSLIRLHDQDFVTSFRIQSWPMYTFSPDTFILSRSLMWWLKQISLTLIKSECLIVTLFFIKIRFLLHLLMKVSVVPLSLITETNWWKPKRLCMQSMSREKIGHVSFSFCGVFFGETNFPSFFY